MSTSTNLGRDTASQEAPAGTGITRTEVQHGSISVPGREVVRALTHIPRGVESGWPSTPANRPDDGFLIRLASLRSVPHR
jgi:hypothetical protein